MVFVAVDGSGMPVDRPGDPVRIAGDPAAWEQYKAALLDVKRQGWHRCVRRASR